MTEYFRDILISPNMEIREIVSVPKIYTTYSMVLQIIHEDILRVVSNEIFIIPLHYFPHIFYSIGNLNRDATVRYAYYSVIRSHILRVLLS